MGNKIVWTLLLFFTIVLGIFYLSKTTVQQGGDISNYFGITESLLSHANVSLTSLDRTNLEKYLHPSYFTDPGYFINGTDGKRYPIHFIFYSILATPVRVILKLLQANELKTLALTNVLIVSAVIALIFKRFSLSAFQKGVLLLLVILSPLAFFFAWPGPDAYYIILLLFSVYLFYAKRYFWASLVAVLASWHSQPLFVLALGYLAAYLYGAMNVKTADGKKRLVIPYNTLWVSVIPVILLAIPYAYNYVVFGVVTPWTHLQNGWTQVYGFGLHNASFIRFFEMLFDLNMGLFWYAPLIFLVGCVFLFASFRRDKRSIFVVGLIFATALFYQTNPPWHFGTAGYGPSRHVLFVLPFLIYFLVKQAKASVPYITLLIFIIVTQLFVLSLNGWFLPNWEHALHQSPIAKYVLNNWPELYNPTPEIFADRTNHTDLNYITTAIYKNDEGVCKKAYVLMTEIDRIKNECGSLPSQYEVMFDNEFLRKANHSRIVWTIEATFWPDSVSCEDWYVPSDSQPYQCMKTLEDVVKYAGVENFDRFTQLDKGVWKMNLGAPVKVTVPPGYILHHYSFEGVYVTYD